MTMRTCWDSARQAGARTSPAKNSRAVIDGRRNLFCIALYPLPLKSCIVRLDGLLRNQGVDCGHVETGFGQNFTGVLAEAWGEPAGRRFGFRPRAGFAHGADAAFGRMVLPTKETGIGEMRIFK